MKNRIGFLIWSVIIIALLTWHFSTAQIIFRNGGYPMGQAISLNGTSQYLSIADNAGSLDQTLDIGLNDGMMSFWINRNTITNWGGVFLKGSINDFNSWGAVVPNSANILFFLRGSSTLIQTSISITTNQWINFAAFWDRSGNLYIFKNGSYSSAISISAQSAINLNSADPFYIGHYPTSLILNGLMDCNRVFILGINGPIVTGAGGVNLSIKLGITIIYSEVAGDGGSVSVPVGLIPEMYQSPSSNLTQLNKSEIDNAIRTECIIAQTDRDFSGANNWANLSMATFDKVDDLTITSAAYGQVCRITNPYLSPLTVGKYYQVVVTASALSGNVFYFSEGTGNPFGPLVNGTNYLIFASSLGADDLRVIADGTGGITLDDFSVRQIGEVADWQLNSVLTDGSGNGLTLINNGAATFVTSKIEALGSVLRSDGSISIHRSVQ